MMLTAELTVAMSKYPMWLGGLSRPPLKPTHEPMVTATGVPPHVEDQQGRVGVLPATGGEPLQLGLSLRRTGGHVPGLQHGDPLTLALVKNLTGIGIGGRRLTQCPVQFVIPQGVRQIAPVLAHGEKAIGDGPVRADGCLLYTSDAADE